MTIKKENCEAIYNEAAQAGDHAIEGMEAHYPCGFAWMIIRPARGAFVNWLKENDIGSKNYSGGYRHSPMLGTQCMDTKAAYCNAFAEVLESYGIKCSTETRWD